jgi:hypothetical protein
MITTTTAAIMPIILGMTRKALPPDGSPSCTALVHL